MTSTNSNNRTVVITNASLLGERSADLVITDGVISQITEPGTANVPDALTIDATGLVALPGLVDPHTHLREPGREDAETILTGTRAAAVGGYTAVMAMANTTPVTDTAAAAEWVHDAGVATPYCDVHPVGAVTKGLNGEELAELGLMNSSRAGVTMFSDDGKCVADPVIMRRALQYVAAFDGVIAQHSQDPRLAPGSSCCDEGPVSGRLGLPGWPAAAEESIIARDIMLAKSAGARLHVCHLSTAGSVELVRWGKAQGVNITAEATPHHLALTADLLESYDSVYKVNPPLRSMKDVEALRAGLADGTIDMVGTDHAPHGLVDKQHDFAVAANGMLGLETALSVVSDVLVHTGAMTWADVAQSMSVRPASLAGLSDQGRPLEVGEPANIALVDPQATYTVDREESASISRNNPWHGRTLRGRVRHTLLRGVPTFLNGELTDLQVTPRGGCA
ncbi:dihydroorotase [Dermatophilus congolensis]|uniref:dihydroorotase n=1 Tax=Dermatophilus congolensis TaxID=1863 RepID=UPI001AAE7418|nr:dihydroorotase [Dermatophilus congolensis]MBO3129011.1 dihydroorotase [Dermatophilus congolensis]MBO3132352.1 dihydroorotase [Dermatophilus congolensis]MBO3133487.1 dihydroorotase [Dermatophilus congolensis]MBO3135721.1 dihydroorotase [Dermatophilus congolensis]MBO3137960.1 dihydroorotase [Dermatophilus congolensis]